MAVSKTENINLHQHITLLYMGKASARVMSTGEEEEIGCGEGGGDGGIGLGGIDEGLVCVQVSYI